jgi:hypothetical protein
MSYIYGVAEGTAHAAMKAGERGAAAHRSREVGELVLLDSRAGVEQNDQAEIVQLGVGERSGSIRKTNRRFSRSGR